MHDDTSHREQRDTELVGRRAFLRRGATATATALVAGTASVQSATANQAQSDPGGGLFAESGVVAFSYATAGFARGVASGVRAWASERVAPSRSYRLQDYVGFVVDEYEQHEDDWLTWVNDRGLGDEHHQSAAITFALDDEEMTRYVLADWDADEAEYVETTITEAFDDEPDVTARLEGPAVENAAEELAELHEQFIEPNEDISTAYASKLAGRYYFGSTQHISSSLLGDLEEEEVF